MPSSAADDEQDEAEVRLRGSIASAIKKMVARGKERGYLTYDELNAALPQDQVSSEQIEDTMTMLSELGISLVERETDSRSAWPLSGRGHVSYSELRQHLKEHLDAVCDSRAPLVVTRRNRESVVMLALSEYESLQETLHLLRSPANAEHLLESIAEAEADRFYEPSLDE
jgi:prevent-host-death family protein